MPLVPRRSDLSPRQEWATDTSNNGKPSGDRSLEIRFAEDNEHTKNWTTHGFFDRDHKRRMNRGHRTAIVIEGLSIARYIELMELAHDIDHHRGSQRTRILNALSQDPHLKWVA